MQRGFCGRSGRAAAKLAPVTDIIHEATGVELVEELAVGVLVEIATIAKCGQRRPVCVFVHDIPRAEFEQDGRAAIVTEQRARESVGQKIEAAVAVRGGTALDQLDQKRCVVVDAEEVPGMQVAFAPRLADAPGELPVVEARAEEYEPVKPWLRTRAPWIVVPWMP